MCLRLSHIQCYQRVPDLKATSSVVLVGDLVGTYPNCETLVHCPHLVHDHAEVYFFSFKLLVGAVGPPH